MFLFPKGALSEFWDRAHLLTTSSSQSPLSSVFASGGNYGRYLAPPLPTKQALRGPREAVVSLPLVGLVRSAEGYPLLAGSTGYAAIHPPGFGGYTCRKNTGKFSGRILQPEMAACENLPPAAFLQRNMETTMFLYSTAIFTGRR